MLKSVDLLVLLSKKCKKKHEKEKNKGKAVITITPCYVKNE